jgi:hypothetical protein
MALHRGVRAPVMTRLLRETVVGRCPELGLAAVLGAPQVAGAAPTRPGPAEAKEAQ